MFTTPYVVGRDGRLVPVLLTIVFVFLLSAPVTAQSLPAGFVNVKVHENYSTPPTGIVFEPTTNQMFVWEKGGRLWVSNWNGAQYVRQATPVLDIHDEVGDWRDFGLQSVCLDPNYSQNGRIYLFYVVDRHHLLYAGTSQYDPNKDEYYNATISRLTRYRLTTTGNGLTADLSSRAVLLGESKSTGVPLLHESHAGGTVLFGNDGTLLLSTGDNASYFAADTGSAQETYWQQAINDGIMRPDENVGAFRSQMLTSLCGKILRLDPETGDGIASNPFYETGNSRSARSRVWALGLRNPYRMVIQPGSGSTNPAEGNPGTLQVGDVGWNQLEEFDIIRYGGENAGWPMFEGLDPEPDYTRAARTLQNKDEPNPTNPCNKPFLTFGDLLKEAQNDANGPATALNACSGQPLPGPQRRYFHSRPALDWRHGTGPARYPSFNGNTATTTTLGSSGATVLGQPFGGNASMAGAWYTGTRFPAEYRGMYFFTDYGYNWIRVGALNANGLTEVKTFAPDNFGKGIVSLQYNKLDQSLYYVNINTSQIFRISYGGNQPPIAAITADKRSGPSPLTVAFRGNTSSDPDGDALTYAWDFGDGTTSTAINPTHTFTAAGQTGFTVRLTVTDSQGQSAQEQVTVSVGNVAPTVRITNPANGSVYPLDRSTQYTLTANVNDDDATGMSYAWQVILHHNNHEHRESIQTQAQPVVTVSPVGCDGETYYYLIRLTVTDRGGLTATDSVKLMPDCGSANLSITGLSARPQNRSATINWTNPAIAYDLVLVVAKEGSGFIDKPNQADYTADSNFGGPGSVLEGGKVVYKGTGTNVTVTGLTNGTKYYFRVYTRRGTSWTGGVETSTTPNLTMDTAACYRFTVRSSGKVMEVDNGSMVDGALVRQRTYAARAWQQWKFQATDGGYYRITAQHSGKALDVSGASQNDVADIVQSPVGSGLSQQWRLQGNSEGYSILLARHSGKALDVSGASLDEGASLIQYSGNGGANQQWLIEPVGCATTGASSDNTADLSLALRVSSRTSPVNQPVTVTMTLLNAGPATAANVTAQSRLPAGMTFLDASSPEVSAANNVVSVNAGTLASGAVVPFVFRVKAAQPGSFATAAQITASSLTDPDSQPNSGTGDGQDDAATVDLRTPDGNGPLTSSPNPGQIPLPDVQPSQPAPDPSKADLSLAMTLSTLVPKQNAAVSLSLTVSNRGGSAASNVAVQALLPTGWQVSNSAGLIVTGQTVTGTLASIPMGGSAILTIPLTAGGTGMLKAQIMSASPDDSDSTAGNGYQIGEDDEAALPVRVRL